MGQAGTLQDQNINLVFDSLDADRDGQIELDDLAGLARSIAQRVGARPGSPQEQKLLDAYFAWWSHLQQTLDTDQNDVITRDEFAQGFQRPGVVEQSSEHSRRVARAIAELLDADQDGYITQDEYIQLSVQFDGMDLRIAQEGFRRLDTDGDGQVTIAELETGWHQMLHSTNPSAPGTALLGQN